MKTDSGSITSTPSRTKEPAKKVSQTIITPFLPKEEVKNPSNKDQTPSVRPKTKNPLKETPNESIKIPTVKVKDLSIKENPKVKSTKEVSKKEAGPSPGVRIIRQGEEVSDSDEEIIDKAGTGEEDSPDESLPEETDEVQPGENQEQPVIEETNESPNSEDDLDDFPKTYAESSAQTDSFPYFEIQKEELTKKNGKKVSKRWMSTDTYDRLKVEGDRLQKDFDQLTQEHQELKDKYFKLKTECNKKYWKFQKFKTSVYYNRDLYLENCDKALDLCRKDFLFKKKTVQDLKKAAEPLNEVIKSLEAMTIVSQDESIRKALASGSGREIKRNSYRYQKTEKKRRRKYRFVVS